MLSKFKRAVRTLFGFLNSRTWGPLIETYEKTRFDHAFDISWSQGGEDIALAAVFQGKIGRYLDVGAHHPDRFSVTRKLCEMGWTGVNVEANPALLPAFNRRRKRDVNVWACVGTEDSYEFNIFSEPAISTVNVDWKEKFLLEGRSISSVISIPGLPLYEIISEYFNSDTVDLLCIDVEGADLDVLISGEFESKPETKPRWILLESQMSVAKALVEPAVVYAMQKLDYEPFAVLTMSTLLKLKNAE